MRVTSTSDIEHQRAWMIGVLISLLGLAAGLVIGLVRPSPTVPSEGIVISKQTGAVYLVSERTLTPTFNLASARLLLAREQLEHPRPGANGAPAEPTVVDEKALANLEVGRRTGIPDAPDPLPSDEHRLDSQHSAWGVCESAGRTTVIAGVDVRKPDLGIPLGDDEVLLVRGPDELDQLLYRHDRRVVRARIGENRALRTAWDLHGVKAKRVTSALLNLVPEMPELKVPGSTEVFRTDEVNGRKRFWVVENGVPHRVTEAVARLIWQKRTDTVPSKALDATTESYGDWDQTRYYPQMPPRAITDDKICVEWTKSGTEVRTDLFTGTAPALGITVNATGPNGEEIDDFVLPAGRAAVVHSGAGGPITLVTDRGISYGVPNLLTAQVLGIAGDDEILEGPDEVIRLLPTGPRLDIGAAVCTYDSVSPAPSAAATPVALPVGVRGTASPPRAGSRRGRGAAPRC